MDRIILAFSKAETADKITRMLDGSGFEVCCVCRSGDELLRAAIELDASLVIMGFKIGGMLAEDIAAELPPDIKLMAIVRADAADMLSGEGIFVLPLPVNRQSLISSIEIFLGVIEKRRKTRRRSEDEKIIDTAKLYLMEKHHMTEEQAHRFLQKRSMDTGAKLTDTARLILHI